MEDAGALSPKPLNTLAKNGSQLPCWWYFSGGTYWYFTQTSSTISSLVSPSRVGLACPTPGVVLLQHLFPLILQFNRPGQGCTGVNQWREPVWRTRRFVVGHLRWHWRSQPQPNHLWHNPASRV